MQSTKTASITETVTVPADELRSLLSVAAKNFAGIVDGQDGVAVVSSDVVVREDGSAVVAIVYEQGSAAASSKADQGVVQAAQADLAPVALPLGLVSPAAAPAVA